MTTTKAKTGTRTSSSQPAARRVAPVAKTKSTTARKPKTAERSPASRKATSSKPRVTNSTAAKKTAAKPAAAKAASSAKRVSAKVTAKVKKPVAKKGVAKTVSQTKKAIAKKNVAKKPTAKKITIKKAATKTAVKKTAAARSAAAKKAAKTRAARATAARRQFLREAPLVDLWEKAESLSQLRTELRRSLRELERLQRKHEKLRVDSKETLKREKNKADDRLGNVRKRLKMREAKLVMSGRYQIGNALVSAVKEPGMNTLKLPFRLIRLTFEGILTTILR